jgi:peroxiredoxin (alkyl hydroperoxide reductase subunit C)
MTAQIGAAAPHFELVDQDRNRVSLTDFRGHKTMVVFIPNPFTGVCEGEVCEIRDNIAALGSSDAKVVVITTHGMFTNKKWAEELGIDFPILSDYWPHGAIADAYGCFNEKLGIAERATYVLDGEGVVREIIATDSLGTPREFSAYTEALANV